MQAITMCPECGTPWHGTTCEEHFHQMLFWEAEFPEYGVVHHLMVLCYHLQHPGLYSPEGLKTALDLLVTFVEKGATTEQVRKANRDKVDSGKRDWKITARPNARGAYTSPVQWTMTAADVVAGGHEKYVDSTRAWAQSMYASLKTSGNLPA
jgi:hypothetical protein